LDKDTITKNLEDFIKYAEALAGDEKGEAQVHTLSFLLELNQMAAEREKQGLSVSGPGLPPSAADKDVLITEDCIRITTDSD
jgi:hypothetical protein